MEFNEIINLKVSFQNNVWEEITQELVLSDVIHVIKHEKLKDEISNLRHLLSQNLIEEYNQSKRSLPAVTFCATFEKTRKIENLKNYNFLVVIDIDKLEKKNLARTEKCLKEDKYVFSYWLSPSGKGFKALVNVIPDDIIEHDQYDPFHKLAFVQLTKYFTKKYAIELDKSGSDISRLCFLSSDHTLVFKNKFEGFLVKVHSIKSTARTTEGSRLNSLDKSKITNILNNSKGKNKASDKRTMINIIKYLEKNQISITDTYEKWYKVAYSIAQTFTYDLGEKFFLKICRLDKSKHDEKASIKLFKYCFLNSRGGFSFRTIIYLAKKEGFKNKRL